MIAIQPACQRPENVPRWCLRKSTYHSIVRLISLVRSYPALVNCVFRGKKGRLVLDQIRSIDGSRLIKKPGNGEENACSLIVINMGSSSVKAAIVNADNGSIIASAFYPETEMNINSPEPDWAEQEPEVWWENTILAIRSAFSKGDIDSGVIKAIGISYQMHRLVALDKERNVLRPSIIWCDSRAVSLGDKAFEEIGREQYLSHVLNSPGNFTASKLKWVKDNEPEVYKFDHILDISHDE